MLDDQNASRPVTLVAGLILLILLAAVAAMSAGFDHGESDARTDTDGSARSPYSCQEKRDPDQRDDGAGLRPERHTIDLGEKSGWVPLGIARRGCETHT